MHKRRYLRGLEEDVTFPRAGVTDRYELPYMGAENEAEPSARTTSHPCSP